jgi:hypothetical protein
VVEQRPFKPKVVGSIPTAPTNILFILLWLEKPEGAQGSIKSLFPRVLQATTCAGITKRTTLLFASRRA